MVNVWKRKMPHLKYYRDEREEFQEESNRKLHSREETTIVLKKLFRHYKLGNPEIQFTSGSNYSKAGKDFWKTFIRINLDTNNFLVICHEIAHLIQLKKRDWKMEINERWHTKKHRTIMKRVINYCRKKNWFEEELQRRTAPKPKKQEPTKDEVRSKRIILLEERKAGYERRIKLAENKIKKLNKQIAGLKRFVNL